MTFAITPVTPRTANASFPKYVQFRNAGTNMGDTGVIVLDFVGNVGVTRGVGDRSHVITIKRTDPGDPYFASVGYLLHFDNPSLPNTFTDVKGNTWARGSGTGGESTVFVSGAQKKFGDGALYIKTTGGGQEQSLFATLASGNYSLGAGNQFTQEGWLYWTGHVDSRLGLGAVYNDVNAEVISIEFYTTNQFKFRTLLNGIADERYVSPPLNQWVHLAQTYDGTTKRWFVNGVIQGSAAVAVGPVQTISAYRVENIPSGGNPPVGYIDDIRFTFGVCRYTSNFTPPAAAFPNF